MNDIFVVRSFNGKDFFLCDPSDAPRVLLYNWTKQCQYGYAQTYGGWGYMHRLIMTPQNGFVVDHDNGVTLDNRRRNLKIVTHRVNIQKSKKPKGWDGIKPTSKYKGVFWYRQTRKWAAHIKIKGRTKNLGYFISEVDAVIAYNKKSKEVYGDVAFQNIIQEGAND